MAMRPPRANPDELHGIVILDDAGEQRSIIAGTGLDVFEVVQVYLAAGRDRKKLRAAFPWLSPEQLDAALAYYAAYPVEVDAAIAQNLAAMSEG